MGNKGLSVELQIEGSVLTMPAKLSLGYRKDGMVVHGTVQAASIRPEELIIQINKDAGAKIGSYLKKMTGFLPEELTFHYENGQSLVWVQNRHSSLGIVWVNNTLACLIRIQVDKNAQSGSLNGYISQAAGLFGIEQIYLYGRRGSGASLPLLTSTVFGKAEEFRYPSAMRDCDVLFCGKFSYDKDKDLVGKFLYMVFGIEQMKLSLFMGMGKQGFAGYAMLPIISGSVMSAEELYLGVECQKGVNMKLAGTFRFSFVPGALFHVDANIGTQGFLLETFAELKNPVTIYKNFKIGDTALAIGVGMSGMTFRMFSNLYIGEIKVFGAIGLAVMPDIVKMEFISAAITDITLPKLIKNIFGKGVNFADELDFIALSGLPLAEATDGKIRISDKDNVKDEQVRSNIVSQFNNLVKSQSFTVDAESVFLERIAGVTGEDIIVLTDKSRMRHYYINAQGKLNLQAQFYFSVVDTRFGDYTIKKGVFVCGSITLFQRFKVRALFSMSQEDGILAYANIDKIDLGIVRIESSGINPQDNPLNYFPQDSLLWLLMDHKPTVQGNKPAEVKPTGAVFFLRAGKNECSFYIDGKVVLFGFYGIAAKILYVGKTISVDVRINIGKLIKAAFQLKASYADFTNLKFSIALIIDCTGLEKALKKVQAGIDQAIKKLREEVNKAQKDLTQAQRNVNELHSQINTLDNKIQDCKRAIKKAKWYQFWIPIGKGAEIAAYEVAKAGIYVAIGVANAALEVAKLAVGIGGIVGEAVLKAINGAISATLNLFFIKYVKLMAAASMKEQSFEAEIEFIALGKTFHFSKTVGAKQFLDQPENLLDENISQRLQPELDNIKNGSFKSHRRRYKKMQCSMREYKKMLGQGMEQIHSSSALLQGMSEIYINNCGEMLPQYEYFNQSYERALGEVEAVLDLTDNSMNFSKMDEAVAMIKKAVKDPTKNIKEEKRQALEPAIKEYEAAMRLVGKINENAQDIRDQRTNLSMQLEQMRKAEAQNLKTKARTATIADEDIEKIVNDTEELLYINFPPTKVRGTYINLGREKKIIEHLDDVRKRMGLSESDSVKKTRTKSTPQKYTQRL